MKPEYYIRKIIYDLLLFLTKLKMAKNEPYSGPSFLATKISIIEVARLIVSYKQRIRTGLKIFFELLY